MPDLSDVDSDSDDEDESYHGVDRFDLFEAEAEPAEPFIPNVDETGTVVLPATPISQLITRFTAALAPSIPAQPTTPLHNSPRCAYHPHRSVARTGGSNLLQKMDSDTYSHFRLGPAGNVYFPFADKREWDVAHWLLQVPLSEREIDIFLQQLDYVGRPCCSNTQH